MKLEPEQIALLQTLWSSQAGRDALEKLFLTAVADQNVVLSVKSASEIFEGINNLLKTEEDRAKRKNQNI